MARRTGETGMSQARHAKAHQGRWLPARPRVPYPATPPRPDRWRWVGTAALVVLAVGVLLLVVAALGVVR